MASRPRVKQAPVKEHDVIEKLKKVKKPLKGMKTFQTAVTNLSMALDQESYTSALVEINTLEGFLSDMDEKDIAVKNVKKSINDIKKQLTSKLNAAGRGLPPGGISGHRILPTETPSLEENASWLANSISKFKKWLLEGATIPDGGFKKGCPKVLTHITDDLEYIRTEMTRRFDLLRWKEEQNTTKLRELLKTLEHANTQPVHVQTDEKRKRIQTSDPDETLLYKIKDLFLENSQRKDKEQIDMLNNLLRDLAKPITKLEEEKLKGLQTSKPTEKIVFDIKMLFLEKCRSQQLPNQTDVQTTNNKKDNKPEKSSKSQQPSKRTDDKKQTNTMNSKTETTENLTQTQTELKSVKAEITIVRKAVEEDQKAVKETLSNTELKEIRQKILDNKLELKRSRAIEEQLKDLVMEIKPGQIKPSVPDGQKGKKSPENTDVMQIRQVFSQTQTELQSVKDEIRVVRKAIEEDQKAEKETLKNTELKEIRQKILNNKHELKSGQLSSRIKDEIRKLKSEIEEGKLEKGKCEKMEKDQTTAIQELGSIGKRVCDWMVQEKQMKDLVREIQSERIQLPVSDGKKGDTGKTDIMVIKQHFSQTQTELQSVKAEIRIVRKAIEEDQKAEKETFNNTELKEIRQKILDNKHELKSIKSTHIEQSAVLIELEIMESRLIASYNNAAKHRSRPNKSPNSKEKHGVMDSLRIMVDRVDEILGRQQSQIESLEKGNLEYRKAIAELHDDIDSIRKQAQKLQSDKEGLIIRLSSVAGAKLTENNSSIADLSDPNRPTKLAEKYRELYDNEWTEAFEAFQKCGFVEENDICRQLFEMLLAAESECSQIASKQENHIRVVLLKPMESQPGPAGSSSDLAKLESTQSKMITDLRKQTAHLSMENVTAFVVNKIFVVKSDKLPKDDEVKKYCRMCVEICWYMSLQTPPVVLEKLDKDQGNFNKDRYREYTKKGTKIDFVVWPPMLLEKGGALMCKGVAQGK